MTIKRFISLVMVSAMLLSCLSLVSCKDNSPAALTLGDCVVTEAMFSYWSSQSKGNYIYSYDDVQNTEKYWTSEIQEGVTVAEYLDELTLESVKSILVASKLFSDYGLSFTEDEENSIEDYIDDLILERAEGSKNMMNTMLGEYGINTKILKTIYLEESKSAKVMDCLFGEGGEMALTEEDYETFYSENYVHFQMIYINNKYQYVTDSEGNRITDDSGYYITEDLNDEEKAKKDAIIDTVKKGLDNGDDFDKLYESYSELKSYPGGYYYSASDSYSDMLYYRLIAEAESLKTGEWAVVESDTGTCIIKKLDNDSGAWAKASNSDFFGTGGADFKELACQTAYRLLIESYYDDIVVDKEIIKKYSVKDVTPAYFF